MNTPEHLSALVQRLEQGFNTDAPTIASCLTPGATLLHPKGIFVSGGEEIASFIHKALSSALQGYRTTFTPVRALELGDSAAWLEMSEVQTRGPEVSPQNALPAEIRKHVVALAIKTPGGWLFEALRPYPLLAP